MADENVRLMGRFVRPIYDAIDHRQYKAAIKLCLHKRVAHLDLVQVLKAHCLERTGRVDEALAICRQVQQRRPTDETLLSTMSLVFRLGGCEHEMLPTYEHACAHAQPPNEELFQSLFVAYVRRGDLLKQQQTALKMYKAFGNNIKYVCWAALAMMLQVEHRGTPAKMLALAEKMLLKALRDAKADDGEALQLAVLTLQLQDKHAEALAAFDEFTTPVPVDKANAKQTASKKRTSIKSTKVRAAEGEGADEEEIELGPMQAIDQLTLEASLSKQVGDWERSVAVTQRLLNDFNGDDWTFLKDFVAANFERTTDLSAARESATNFLTELSGRSENVRSRGPVLAIIHLNAEVLRRLHGASASQSELEKTEQHLLSLILSYIDRFGTKACCFTDLKQYYELFLSGSTLTSATAKSKLLDEVVKLSTASQVSANATQGENERKEGLNRLSRRLLTLKTLRYLGYYENESTVSVNQIEALVKDLVAEYEATSWLNEDSKGGQREVQATDDLLLLAAHFLLDIYQRSSGRRELLLQAASLLEYGLDKSTYNFQMKLLLSRVYGFLSAGEAMLSHHQELDVKYVQLDSLSFLVFDKLLRLGHYTEARKLGENIQRLHRSTSNDTPEFIARAYRLGVYSKVLDMTTFLYKRMNKSHTLAIAQGEALRFEIHDALVGGPAKLNELATMSVDFLGDTNALAELIDGELSHNQHRDVVVEWSHRMPQIPTADTFQPDDAPLVECDRSANVKTSVTWLRLQVVVARLIRGVASNDRDEVVKLAEEYAGCLNELEVGTEGVHAQVWRWSESVIQLSAKMVGAITSQDEQQANTSWVELQSDLAGLETAFTAITALITSALSSDSTVEPSEENGEGVALSPYGVSALTTLLAEAGLFALSLLALLLRSASKKKGKKDDPHAMAVHALRSLLKHMQESLVGLESHVSGLKVVSSTASETSGVALVEFDGVRMAKARVAENVVRSYRTIQQRLSESIHEGVVSIRALLQK